MFDTILDRASSSRATLLRVVLTGPAVAEHSPAPTPTTPMLLTAREAAKTIAVCEKTLWAMTKAGEIPVVRVGRAIRYDRFDLTAWVGRAKCNGADSSASD